MFRNSKDLVKVERVLFISFVVLMCLFIPMVLNDVYGNKINSHDWINFYGSYLGGLIGIFFAYINTEIQLKKSKQNDLDNELRLKVIENLALLYNNSTKLLVDINNASNELQRYGRDKNSFKLIKTFKIKKSISEFVEFYNCHLAFLDLEDAQVLRVRIEALKDSIDDFFNRYEKIFLDANKKTEASYQLLFYIHREGIIMSDLSKKLSNTIKEMYDKAKAIE